MTTALTGVEYFMVGLDTAKLSIYMNINDGGGGGGVGWGSWISKYSCVNVLH